MHMIAQFSGMVVNVCFGQVFGLTKAYILSVAQFFHACIGGVASGTFRTFAP